VSIQHAAPQDLCAAVRVDFTRRSVVRKHNNNKKKQKSKHGAGARRSKVYVYYDEFKAMCLQLEKCKISENSLKFLQNTKIFAFSLN
jgi:hypothetical protein